MGINKSRKKAQPQPSSSFTPPNIIPESPTSMSRQDRFYLPCTISENPNRRWRHLRAAIITKIRKPREKYHIYFNFSIHHNKGGHSAHPHPPNTSPVEQKGTLGAFPSASITRSLTSERYHHGKMFLQQRTTTQMLTSSKFKELAGR